VFSCHLSALEGLFYWKPITNGTAESVVYLRVNIHQDHCQQPKSIHFGRAGLALKRRYLAIAGQMKDYKNDGCIDIVVCESSLSRCGDGDISFFESNRDDALGILDCAANALNHVTGEVLIVFITIVRPSPQSLSASIVSTLNLDLNFL
jgi:hypothetical protein